MPNKPDITVDFSDLKKTIDELTESVTKPEKTITLADLFAILNDAGLRQRVTRDCHPPYQYAREDAVDMIIAAVRQRAADKAEERKPVKGERHGNHV